MLKWHMTSNPILAVRLEQASGSWCVYLASIETDRISVCAGKKTGLVLNLQAKHVNACTSFVHDLLWKSLVNVSSLLVPEHLFLQGFGALEGARGSKEIHVISAFDGVLSRDDVGQYVEQVSNISVC